MTRKLASRAGSALFWKGGQLVGTKVIFLVRTIVLARLLSPDDFGLFAIAVVAIQFLLGITETGMIPALVQRERPESQHYQAAWTVGVLRAVVVAGILVLAAPLVAELFAEPRAVDLLRALALWPVLQAGASIRVATLVRDLEFREIAWMRLPEAVVNAVVSIALAIPLGVWALVAGPLAGSVTYVVLSYMIAPHRPRLELRREAVRPLIRYGRWILVTAVVTVSGGAVLKLAISRQLGTFELGLYYMALQVAFLPSEVAGYVVGAVAFPVYARLQDRVAEAVIAFRSMVKMLFAFMVPVSLVLAALAPSLVEHVLGSRWEGAVGVIRVLALVNIVGLLGEAIVPLLKGVGRPDRVAVHELVRTGLLVALVWELAARLGVVGAALAWIPAFAVSAIVGIWFARQTLARPFAGFGTPLAVMGGVSALAAGVAWGLDALLPGLAGLLSAAAAAAWLTVAALWFVDVRLGLELQRDLARAFPRLTPLFPACR